METLMAPDEPVRRKKPGEPDLLNDPEDRRLWKKFRQIRTLSERDQAHLFKTLTMLIESKGGMERSA